jgi:hypothetical protein
MSTLKKCIISIYDETITEPPYLTIPIDTVEVYQPEKDNLGEQFYENLKDSCRTKGYLFKFYSLSKDKNFDYEIVVYQR